jgi:16S rRNA (guanine527-N7)-methyltransferase
MQEFLDACRNLVGLRLTPEQVQAFRLYEDELSAWNEKFNLTAIRDREEIRTKHFLDSLTCLPRLGDIRGLHLIDIGTGAGFPGLPIKIAEPGVEVTLVDSVGKKLAFCEHMIQALAIQNARCIQSRAEDLGQAVAHREKYDRGVARAVAGLPVLLEYLLPLLKVGGFAVIQKGSNAPGEVEEAQKAVKVLGGEIESVTPVILLGIAETRYLVTVGKIKPTPGDFPRRAGIPSRKPII